VNRKSASGKRPPSVPVSLKEVVELAERHNLAELEVESEGTRIRVVRERAPAASVRRAARPPERHAPQLQPDLAEVAVASSLVTVEAPIVGTFYRASSPGAAPFVSEGDLIKEGQVLGIIEAMKLMNEIEAKLAGRIAQVLVENGQPVEYGQPLFLIEPRH
jgi:acetyl-CoA carboxylase biotin carboxyl carrier protein